MSVLSFCLGASHYGVDKNLLDMANGLAGAFCINTTTLGQFQPFTSEGSCMNLGLIIQLFHDQCGSVHDSDLRNEMTGKINRIPVSFLTNTSLVICWGAY